MCSVESLSANLKDTGIKSFIRRFLPDMGHFVFMSGGFTSVGADSGAREGNQNEKIDRVLRRALHLGGDIHG